VRFPSFDLLHLFEAHPEAKYHVSSSGIRDYAVDDLAAIVKTANLGAASFGGDPALREEIAKIHGVPSDRVRVTCGASEANFLVAAALVRPGDRVLVENPTYPPLRNVPLGLGADVVPVPRDPDDGFRLDMDVLAREGDGATLFVATNLNNPTSASLSARDIDELAALAEEYDLYVHLDETFRETDFTKPPPSAASASDRFVCTGTLTKLYGLGGLRLGWVVAAPEVLAGIKNVHDHTTIVAPSLSERIGLWALRRRDVFLARAWRILKGNREIVQDWAEREHRIDLDMPRGGIVCFPAVDVDATKLGRHLAARYATVLAPGELFGMGGRFRLGMGGDGDNLQTGLANVSRALRDIG
jgi:aspartate/methionine/tyrosine aminotransferase